MTSTRYGNETRDTNEAGGLEFDARAKCGQKVCGEEHDACLLAELRPPRQKVQYVRTCEWDLQCARGGSQTGNLAMTLRALACVLHLVS